ncbi:MAG: gephyrin-like molybdotransferase Glp [Alcanivoracaceae bacterium]
MACHDEPGMLPVDTCRARLLAQVSTRTRAEAVPLADAIDRISAVAIVARLNVPPTDNSAMDGYAIHGADLEATAALTLIGDSFAGHPFSGTLQPGQCVRIMTGGVVPDGASAVIMQEQASLDVDHITLQRTLKPGENIRRCGEDTIAGDTLLPAGRRLCAADIGLLASQGIDTVSVQSQLRIALISTGDELVPAGAPLGPGQIHDSNRAMLHAALVQAGFAVIDMGHVMDDADALRARFRDADAAADVVMTSGGVSVGEADLVRNVIGELGDILVWKIAIKPGKPFAFGTLPHSYFFGLPGNPVSALVTLQELAMPALLRMQGGQWQPPLQLPATLLAPVRKKPGRAEYQRGVVTQDSAGNLLVTPLPNQSSGALTSMSRANAFVLLELEQGNLAAGETVKVQLF